MNTNQRRRGALLVVTLSLMGLIARAASSDEYQSGELVPEDTCLIQLQLPDGAVANIDGRQYGPREQIKITQLKPRMLQRKDVHVDFRGGVRADYSLLLEGG